MDSHYVDIYIRRVRSYNQYEIVLKKTFFITNVYVVLLTILYTNNIYWLYGVLVNIGKSKYSVDFYTTLPILLYILLLLLNVLLNIVGVIYKNFKRFWFAALVFVFIVIHISFMSYELSSETIEHCVHYKNYTNIDNGKFVEKNHPFQRYCNNVVPNDFNAIQARAKCIDEFISILSESYHVFDLVIIISCCSFIPLIFALAVTLIISKKIENSFLIK